MPSGYASVRSQSAKPISGKDASKKYNDQICVKRCNSFEVKKQKENINHRQRPKSMVHPKIISLKEYKYLRDEACGKSAEEIEAELEKIEREKERLSHECMKRKEELHKIDSKKIQQKDVVHDEIQAEEQKKTSYLLDRAEQLQLEQEEEIKRCNRIILETKCRVIRDAQIAEKKLIKRQLEREEKRLNEMMENERQSQMLEEEKKEQEKVAKQHYFVETLKNQIAENEEQKYLEFERKLEESRIINLDNIAWQQSEMTKMQEKQAEHTRIQRELAEVNEQIKHFKRMEKEENEILDQRIRKFQKLKEEQEAKLVEEKKKLLMKKEHEKKLLVEQAIHSKKFQEQIEEINASRVQEEVEREWRQKEKAEALRRLEKRKNLLLAREEQMKNKRLLQAIEIERDKREYQRVLEIQKAALIGERVELEKKQKKAEKHKNEILKQVNQKERERIESRKQMFEEGLAIQAKDELRKMKLEEAIKRKCNELKGTSIPEMYIDELRRMIKNV